MKGPTGRRKKIECLCKLQTPGKLQVKNSVFRENNFYKLIDSSVNVYFAVNFQTKAEKPLCFLITFLSRWRLVRYVRSPTCCVTLSELSFGETIGDTADLQTIIYHFSRF